MTGSVDLSLRAVADRPPRDPWIKTGLWGGGGADRWEKIARSRSKRGRSRRGQEAVKGRALKPRRSRFKGRKARRQGQRGACKKGAIKCKCTHIPCCDPWRVEGTSRRPPPSAATDYPRPSPRLILEHPRPSFLPRPPLYPAAARASSLSYRFQRPCGSEKRAKRAVLWINLSYVDASILGPIESLVSSCRGDGERERRTRRQNECQSRLGSILPPIPSARVFLPMMKEWRINRHSNGIEWNVFIRKRRKLALLPSLPLPSLATIAQRLTPSDSRQEIEGYISVASLFLSLSFFEVLIDIIVFIDRRSEDFNSISMIIRFGKSLVFYIDREEYLIRIRIVLEIVSSNNCLRKKYYRRIRCSIYRLACKSLHRILNFLLNHFPLVW